MKHHGPISGIATSGLNYIATASYDNSIILWDALHHFPIARSNHDHLANQLSFSLCGKFLVTASSDYSARIWDIPSLRLNAVIQVHNDDVEMAMFNQASSKVATCSRDNTLAISNLKGECLVRMRGHQADVVSVCWGHDDETVVSTSDDGTVRVWCSTTGVQLEAYNFDGIETDTIAVMPDSTIVAGNDSGEIVKLKDGVVKNKIQAHASGVKRITYDERQSLIISLGYDSKAKIWDVTNQQSLKLINTVQLPEFIWPRSCALLTVGAIVFGTFGSKYAVYDFNSENWNASDVCIYKSFNVVTTESEDIYAAGDSGVVYKNGAVHRKLRKQCNFLLPYEDLLIGGGQSGEVIDVNNKVVIYKHNSPLNCGAICQLDEDVKAIIGTYSGEILAISLEGVGGSIVADVIQIHENAIKGVAINRAEIFTVCAAGSVVKYDLSKGKLLRKIDNAHSKIANGCVAIGDAQYASVSRDLKLYLWLKNESKVVDTPHTHSIKCISYLPKHNYILTGDYIGVVGLYDLNAQCWINISRPTCSGISSLAVMGDIVIAASYDGNLYKFTSIGDYLGEY